jgi:hypothetical protein
VNNGDGYGNKAYVFQLVFRSSVKSVCKMDHRCG